MDLSLKCIVITAWILAVQGTSWAGGVTGGGGDVYSDEFVSIAYTTLIPKISQYPIAGVDLATLVGAIGKTKVTSEDSLELDGHDVSAINYPDPLQPRIEMSRADWDLMKTETFRKTFLVFHEFLGIIGVDDSSYRVSEQLDSSHVCSRTPAVRQAIESALDMTCDRMIPSDLTRVHILSVQADSFQAGDFFDLPNLYDLTLLGNFTEVPVGIFNSADVSLHSDTGFDLTHSNSRIQVSSGQMEHLNESAFSDIPGIGGELDISFIKHVTPSNFGTMGFSSVLFDTWNDPAPFVIDSFGFAGERAPNQVVILPNSSDLELTSDSFSGFRATDLYLNVTHPESLNPDVVSGLESVQALSVATTEFLKWPLSFFSALPNLTNLKIQHSDATEIPVNYLEAQYPNFVCADSEGAFGCYVPLTGAAH